MHHFSKIRGSFLGVAFLIFSSISHAQQPATNAPAANPAPSSSTSTGATASGSATADDKIQEAFNLMVEHKQDEALASVNQALALAPKNIQGLTLRGEIYTFQNQLDLAQKDYETAAQLDPQDAVLKFNLAELDFMRKKYDVARSGFLALQKDADYGDVSSYKVFMCDLLGGNIDQAGKELDVFNQKGENPSYYFSNLAWAVEHKNIDDARNWFHSAQTIYSARKINLYATTLKNVGYLPLPPASGTE